MLILDQSAIKVNNRKRILRLLSEQRELTKQDIARILDISIPTVSTIVAELIVEGILEEAGIASSTGGRKPIILRFIPTSYFSLGVDLCEDFVRVILTDLDSTILKDVKVQIEDLDFNNLLDIIKSTVKEILKDSHIEISKVLGLGISLPGIVNNMELKLDIAPNFNLRELDFKPLKAELNIPIFIENEANAGALGEAILGIAKEMDNLIYISITEGIGGGIIFKQEVHRGRNSKAGEIGHMTIDKFGKVCSCGKKGCWETTASKRALIKYYEELTSAKVKNIKIIFDKYKMGEDEAFKALEIYSEELAIGIQNLIYIFNPDYIVIGGEISRYEDILLPLLEKKIFSECHLYNSSDVKLLFAKLKEDSNILGASLMPITEAFGFNNIM
ncbi:ArsR family transcriptional regulator [Clostridium polyendosporum]|uniref:ArsR family transcriptional regulator n=1 Tax=Clostridium polyendosporum TaxID=69208 RepID=A0A919VKK9_9CLOT|nr:ROK family transcriptional regulator [Clostridium polyendosporum]GIM27708.1 ArsR family transcriptional regulator [Clostridium polyendosporum]